MGYYVVSQGQVKGQGDAMCMWSEMCKQLKILCSHVWAHKRAVRYQSGADEYNKGSRNNRMAWNVFEMLCIAIGQNPCNQILAF